LAAKNKLVWTAVPILLLSLALASAGRAQNRTESCITCHEFLGGKFSLPVIEWRSSTHQIEGVTCSACHGGNPDVPLGDLSKLSEKELQALAAAAMYDTDDFVARPKGEAQFELCANCHEESVNLYRNSLMGEAYLKDKGGPSCTKCHGAHYNVIPDVPKVCQDCHTDVTGYDQITAMDVTEQTIDELYQIRAHMALSKVQGEEVKIFPKELESFQIGFITIGIILLLLILAVALYYLLERRG